MSLKNENIDLERNIKEENGCNHNTSLLMVENENKSEEDQRKIHNRPTSAERWRKAKDDIIRNKRSLKWIIGETSDEADLVSQDDGCCKWIKRFLTIGNIVVIMACFCLLIASFVVCFRK